MSDGAIGTLLIIGSVFFDYCEPHTCDLNHELGEQNSQRI